MRSQIDLLRAGQHVLAMPEWAARGRGPYSYLICVNRAEGRRDRFECYPWQLRQRLPRIRVPLAAGDPDVVLDVQAVLAQSYEAGSYRERLRYDRPCVPPLPAEDQAWADQLIRAAQQGAGCLSGSEARRSTSPTPFSFSLQNVKGSATPLLGGTKVRATERD